MPRDSELFRSEALSHRADRLAGDVSVALPVTWQAIGYFLFSSVGITALFFATATYSRVETVEGVITPENGVVAVVPTRPGIITSVFVDEGQRVSKGRPLIAINGEQAQAMGPSVEAGVENALDRQADSLREQSAALTKAGIAQINQLAVQRTGLIAEVQQIETQMKFQRELVQSAQKDLDRVQDVAKRGFLSGRELRAREETLIARKQGLSQLEQSLATRRASIEETGRTIAQLSARADSEIAGLKAAQAQTDQQVANARGARELVIKAPVDGIVTGLTAKAGVFANSDSLMQILPSEGKLRVELEVPPTAIGFVRAGQEVRISVDAFPAQRFGTVSGKVKAVAQTAIERRNKNGLFSSFYLVTVSLPSNVVQAYGETRPLMSSMTVRAQIVAERQSLLAWLLDPLFAAGTL